MPDAIRAVRAAFEAHSSGRAVMPVRGAAPLPEGTVLSMLAALPEDSIAAVKVVSVHPGNPGRGLPTVQALVVALDAATGRPLAIMEGGWLTGLRTGAASGVATDLLARPDADALALLGAGFQARFQAEAVAAVRALRAVRVYSRDPGRRERFASELQAHLAEGGHRAEVSPAGSAGEAVRGADIVCAATTSAEPVFEGADLAPGAHVNGVGSYRLDMRELPLGLLRSARVFVDSREAAEAEAGDLAPAVEEGTLSWAGLPELGEALLGRAPGRLHPRGQTVFKSVGLAVQDAAVAGLVARRARELGLGLPLPGMDAEAAEGV
jgi:ornithine cyclodeaminase